MTPGGGHSAGGPRRILVLGGYGAVGREAVAALRDWYDGELIIAGRNPRKGELRLDVSDRDALERAVSDVDVVLNCVERNNALIAELCLRQGVHFLDVTASPEILDQIEALEPLAQKSTAVLSVGLAPGVTNLLAALCAGPETKVGLLIGGGEQHGRAALEWTIDGLAQLGDSWSVRFPAPYGVRTVRRFPFSGPQTGLCLDSRPLTALLGAGARPGVRRVLRSNAALTVLSRIHVGSDGFAVVAGDGRSSASLTGRRQSRATGLVAALLIRRLGEFPPGVRHIEQLVDPSEFLAELASHGFRFEVDQYAPG